MGSRTVSRDLKRRIGEAFRNELPRPEEDVDRALQSIRQSLKQRQGGRINFYGPGSWRSGSPLATLKRHRSHRRKTVVLRGAWLMRGTSAQGVRR